MISKEKLESKTDEELVVLTREDPEYYYFLMSRYEEKILRYVKRITGLVRESAEDLVQEIFLKAYQNINDFDEKLKFSSWIYRIARNHAVSFWRKNKKEKDVYSWDAHEGLKNILNTGEDTVRDLDLKIEGRKISEALDSMKPVYRDVLVLKYLEEKDYNEISDILKKPPGTVGTLISRAKKEFKKKYDLR